MRPWCVECGPLTVDRRGQIVAHHCLLSNAPDSAFRPASRRAALKRARVEYRRAVRDFPDPADAPGYVARRYAAYVAASRAAGPWWRRWF